MSNFSGFGNKTPKPKYQKERFISKLKKYRWHFYLFCVITLVTFLMCRCSKAPAPATQQSSSTALLKLRIWKQSTDSVLVSIPYAPQGQQWYYLKGDSGSWSFSIVPKAQWYTLTARSVPDHDSLRLQLYINGTIKGDYSGNDLAMIVFQY